VRALDSLPMVMDFQNICTAKLSHACNYKKTVSKMSTVSDAAHLGKSKKVNYCRIAFYFGGRLLSVHATGFRWLQTSIARSLKCLSYYREFEVPDCDNKTVQNWGKGVQEYELS
jgi:hypothetical protein